MSAWDFAVASEELEERARRLAATWARDLVHEMRGPLTVLRMCASLVPGMAARGDAHELSFAAGAIDRNARRLDVILGAVGTEALIATDGLTLARAPRDLGIVSRTVAAEAAVLLGDRPLDLRVQDGVVALVDEDRIGQILVNLIANAARFSPPGAPVTVETRRRGTTAEVAVIDHGPGIPVEDRQRVFERGVTLDDPQSGTGLGLYISRLIAEAHGGSLEVADAPGCHMVLSVPACV